MTLRRLDFLLEILGCLGKNARFHKMQTILQFQILQYIKYVFILKNRKFKKIKN